MTTEQALAMIWVLTMVVLGLVWQRMTRWKQIAMAHHHALGFAQRLIATMQHTDETNRLLAEAHQRYTEGVKQK